MKLVRIPENMKPEQNMGLMDRIVRSALGGAMLMWTMNKEQTSAFDKAIGVVGGAFLVYGLTGWDPLLQAFDSTTKAGDDRNVLNKAKNSEMVQKVSDKAGDVIDKAGDMMGTVSQRASELADRIPDNIPMADKIKEKVGAGRGSRSNSRDNDLPTVKVNTAKDYT